MNQALLHVVLGRHMAALQQQPLLCPADSGLLESMGHFLAQSAEMRKLLERQQVGTHWEMTLMGGSKDAGGMLEKVSVLPAGRNVLLVGAPPALTD